MSVLPAFGQLTRIDRIPGYYLVRVATNRPTVALWTGRHWSCCGSTETYADDTFAWIDAAPVYALERPTT